MDPAIKKLTEDIEKLQAQVASLTRADTIPHEVDSAFRERFKDLGVELIESAALPATYSRAVNESGSSSYSVSKLMDGLREIHLTDGTTLYIPYYL